MTLYQGRFLVSRGGAAGDVWAEGEGENVVLYRGDSTQATTDRTELLSVRHDQFGRLAAWADPQTLSVGFTGLLARQVRDLAKEVGLTPQNFVLEAVNAFIQAGEMAAGHGHAHGGPEAPSGGQSIEIESP